MKTFLKYLFIIIIIYLVFTMIITVKSYASADEVLQEGKSFLEHGYDDKINEDNLADASQTIYNIFFVLAIGIAVIVGAIIGIKIMTGTIEEKAKMKEMLIPYGIGVALVFSIFFVWSTIVNIFISLFGKGEFNPAYYSDPNGAISTVISLTSSKGRKS